MDARLLSQYRVSTPGMLALVRMAVRSGRASDSKRSLLLLAMCMRLTSKGDALPPIVKDNSIMFTS